MVRFKHRYLLVELLFPRSLTLPCDEQSPRDQTVPQPAFNESGLVSLLRDSLLVNFGDVGAGEVGGTFNIKYLSPHTNMLIIRVAREHHRTLWAALTLLRKVGGQEVIVRCLHVSGTIRKTQHVAMRLDRETIMRTAKRTRLAEDQIKAKLQQSKKAIDALEA